MPKKKRRRVISKKKLQEKRLAAYPLPVFSVGNLVQVNNDVMDANWNDLPLGGWVYLCRIGIPLIAYCSGESFRRGVSASDLGTSSDNERSPYT
ncbi:MAG: hypothetical protein LBI05_09430, partial [Planctomycetaceae bacterium]|nr:hypothetical protein [Planctomycetaceae bacterium]